MHRHDVEFAVEGGVTLRGWLFCRTLPAPILASRGRTVMPGCASTGWSASLGCSPTPATPAGIVMAKPGVSAVAAIGDATEDHLDMLLANAGCDE